MQTMITHNVTTISHDYFTITRDLKNDKFFVTLTDDADSEVWEYTLSEFQTVFLYDTKILSLFGVQI